ncbi:MAG: hypothetical protein ACLQQ4_18545 [Bacteroidia bacterium]
MLHYTSVSLQKIDETATSALFLWGSGLMTINVITEFAVTAGVFRHCEERSNLNNRTLYFAS